MDEKRIHARKGTAATKDLRRQLTQERRHDDRLQQALQDASFAGRAAKLSPPPESAAHQMSSWSPMRDESGAAPPSVTGGGDATVVTETVSLLARIIQLQEEKWPTDTERSCRIALHCRRPRRGRHKLRGRLSVDVSSRERQRNDQRHVLDRGCRRELWQPQTTALLDVRWPPAPLAECRRRAAAVNVSGRLPLLLLLLLPLLLLLLLLALLLAIQERQQVPRLKRQVTEPGWTAPVSGLVAARWESRHGRTADRQRVFRRRAGSTAGLRLWMVTCRQHETGTRGFHRQDATSVCSASADRSSCSIVSTAFSARQASERRTAGGRSSKGGGMTSAARSICRGPLADVSPRTNPEYSGP